MQRPKWGKSQGTVKEPRKGQGSRKGENTSHMGLFSLICHPWRVNKNNKLKNHKNKYCGY